MSKPQFGMAHDAAARICVGSVSRARTHAAAVSWERDLGETARAAAATRDVALALLRIPARRPAFVPSWQLPTWFDTRRLIRDLPLGTATATADERLSPVSARGRAAGLD